MKSSRTLFLIFTAAALVTPHLELAAGSPASVGRLAARSDISSSFTFSSPTPVVITPIPAPAAVPLLVQIPPAAPAPARIGLPAELVIPSIRLDDQIQDVGVNAVGEMDVPSGKTMNVGWYAAGTVPGNEGSAVLDAHVFAAFSNLKNLKPGSDIFVVMGDGKKLHFVAREADVYALADVPLQKLFNRSGGQYLNLITCAGKLTADRSTYDHRLIVYAELVNV